MRLLHSRPPHFPIFPLPSSSSPHLCPRSPPTPLYAAVSAISATGTFLPAPTSASPPPDLPSLAVEFKFPEKARALQPESVFAASFGVCGGESVAVLPFSGVQVRFFRQFGGNCGGFIGWYVLGHWSSVQVSLCNLCICFMYCSWELVCVLLLLANRSIVLVIALDFMVLYS